MALPEAVRAFRRIRSRGVLIPAIGATRARATVRTPLTIYTGDLRCTHHEVIVSPRGRAVQTRATPARTAPGQQVFGAGLGVTATGAQDRRFIGQQAENSSPAVDCLSQCRPGKRHLASGPCHAQLIVPRPPTERKTHAKWPNCSPITSCGLHRKKRKRARSKGRHSSRHCERNAQQGKVKPRRLIFA